MFLLLPSLLASFYISILILKFFHLSMLLPSLLASFYISILILKFSLTLAEISGMRFCSALRRSLKDRGKRVRREIK